MCVFLYVCCVWFAASSLLQPLRSASERASLALCASQRASQPVRQPAGASGQAGGRSRLDRSSSPAADSTACARLAASEPVSSLYGQLAACVTGWLCAAATTAASGVALAQAADSRATGDNAAAVATVALAKFGLRCETAERKPAKTSANQRQPAPAQDAEFSSEPERTLANSSEL